MFVSGADPGILRERAAKEAHEKTKRELMMRRNLSAGPGKDEPRAVSAEAPRTLLRAQADRAEASMSDQRESPPAIQEAASTLLHTLPAGPELPMSYQDTSCLTAGSPGSLTVQTSSGFSHMAQDNHATCRHTADRPESLMAQASPESPGMPPKEFKFHQPKLFVGRLAGRTAAPNATALMQANGNGRRVKKRRRRTSGRPDIRAMPDSLVDPIETP
jgi:hypothetical protein